MPGKCAQEAIVGDATVPLGQCQGVGRQVHLAQLHELRGSGGSGRAHEQHGLAARMFPIGETIRRVGGRGRGVERAEELVDPKDRRHGSVFVRRRCPVPAREDQPGSQRLEGRLHVTQVGVRRRQDGPGLGACDEYGENAPVRFMIRQTTSPRAILH